MQRRLLTGGAIVATGGIGWAAGSVQATSVELAHERSLLRDNPLVRDFKAKMRKQGFQDVTEARRLVASKLEALHHTHMFSNTILKGPNRLDPEGPLILRNLESGEVLEIFHIGSELRHIQYFYSACATMFDECLALTAFPRLPNKIGVTASLDLSLNEESSWLHQNGSPGLAFKLLTAAARDPAPADDGGIVVLHAHIIGSKGRKSEVAAEMYELTARGPGRVLASGHALFIEPWWGKYIRGVM